MNDNQRNITLKLDLTWREVRTLAIALARQEQALEEVVRQQPERIAIQQTHTALNDIKSILVKIEAALGDPV